MQFRHATLDDAPFLARFNQQLIHDEGHRNAMTLEQLTARMADWLTGAYRAVIFSDGDETLGYTVFRDESEYLYIRQFFIVAQHRRRGHGRAAFLWLREHEWANARRLRLDALISNRRGIAFWRSLGFMDYCMTLEMEDEPAPAITDGLRVFTCGHSFHAFVPDILIELARSAGLDRHRVAGSSSIGASRAIQHWQVPEELNDAKRLLRAGKVDVLTLSCMTEPDEGIRHFAKLAAAHNPDVRVTLQELWLPEDRFPFDPLNRVRQSVDQFNDATIDGLRIPHAAYFKVMEDYVTAVNTEIGRQVLFIVPDAQATLALRQHIIAGTAPGLSRQSDLFRDPWGHPTAPLRALAAYCHFSVIYRRSPDGLPMPSGMASENKWPAELNALLQQLAWTAAREHPMSGVRAAE